MTQIQKIQTAPRRSFAFKIERWDFGFVSNFEFCHSNWVAAIRLPWREKEQATRFLEQIGIDALKAAAAPLWNQ